MAASLRSPSMRDQRRVEDDHRGDDHRRARIYSDRRRRSPALQKHQGVVDVGVKIKGRATADRGLSTPKPAELIDKPISKRQETGRSSHSPHKRYNGGVGTKRSQNPGREASADRYKHRDNFRSSIKRKRSRSSSLRRESNNHSEGRARSRSPTRSGGVELYRPASSHRERSPSSLSASRADHYSASHNDISSSAGRSARDLYVPSSQRHRPRSPASQHDRKASVTSKNLPSTSRRHHPVPKSSSHSYHTSPRDRVIGKETESPSRHHHLSRSHELSPYRHPNKRHQRKESRSLSPVNSRRNYRSKKGSHTSAESRRNKSEHTKMQSSTRPIQSILDESPRPPSPPRPIPSFDSDSHDSGGVRDVFPMHGMKANEVHGPIRQGRPQQIDTRQSYSTSPQWTPTSSHHGSPQSGSPFSHGRGGWGGQPQNFHGQPGQNMNAYSPPFRQNGFPQQNGAQGQYYPSNQPSQYNNPPQQGQPSFQNQSFRGGHGGYRGSHFGQAQDRRFSGPGASNYGINPPRGRGGHFQNLQWTASGGSRGRGQNDQSHNAHQQTAQSLSPPQLQQQQQSCNEPASLPDDDDNPFRPSKDLQVEDQSEKDTDVPSGVSPGSKKMPPPSRQTSGSSQAKESSKFSFAFKAKATPQAAAKPGPDLAQKLKEPLKKENLLDAPKLKPIPPATSREPLSSRPRAEHRVESRLDRREDRRERDYREDYREEQRSRDDRHNDRDYRDQRRPDYRGERRPDREQKRVRERDRDRDRERERSPEPKREKKTLKRPKPRPTLQPEFAKSTSVYYRKPGNESVVGSGTYGKVFKAVHVYTNQLAALKKIRMDGEKDGFPVTAVREIKLLQSLKHDNVVCLQEVMVENNDCFMVFEYLSHDLTGLLHHPTFKLENSHKKHFGRQLFEGLNYLHRRGVLHRDIKAANILVSNMGQLKLADFGLARFFSKRGQPDYTNRVVTIWYRPPELLLGETQYGPAVDIWSAACVMIEIFTRHPIFPGDGGEISQLDKMYGVLGTPTVSEWPGLGDMAWFELMRPTERRPNTFAEKYQERLTPSAFELIQAMFQYDPSKRPTASDVLEHPYFTTEDPAPQPAVELKDLEGDWHEFESKALRKENERKNQEARRAVRLEEKEKEKRRASGSAAPTEREPKRLRPSSSHSAVESK